MTLKEYIEELEFQLQFVDSMEEYEDIAMRIGELKMELELESV